MDQLKKDRLLLGWRPVLNLAEEDAGVVRAVIEVRITPERGGGFNRLAERISRFDEVESCYLMSGGYDLLVFVNGSSLQKVAGFVSEKLSTLEGVLSTATHFLLRTYKEQGFLLDVKAEENEPAEGHAVNKPGWIHELHEWINGYDELNGDELNSQSSNQSNNPAKRIYGITLWTPPASSPTTS